MTAQQPGLFTEKPLSIVLLSLVNPQVFLSNSSAVLNRNETSPLGEGSPLRFRQRFKISSSSYTPHVEVSAGDPVTQTLSSQSLTLRLETPLCTMLVRKKEAVFWEK